MKKRLILFATVFFSICIIVTLSLTFAVDYRYPITTNVIVENLENSHHDMKNMESAKDALINYFRDNYKGCTLKTIFYIEEADTYLNGIYNKDKYYDIIVLTTKVKTDKLQEALKPNANVELNFVIGKKTETVGYRVLEVKENK